jgi:toxin YoeB
MVSRSKTAEQLAPSLTSATQPWALLFSKQAQKDASKLAAAGLKPKAMLLLDLITANPIQTPPPCEKLVGDLHGAYSRRINIQHRLVYQVLENTHEVRVLRLWTHYD